jgi:uncharacterized protein YprB with RNaseH-like and TPR domain
VSSLADRLRGVIRPPIEGGSKDPPLHRPDHGGRHDAAEVLGGEWHEVRGQRFLVVDRKYAPGYRHGRVALADCLPPDTGIWPRLHLLDCRAALPPSHEASADRRSLGGGGSGPPSQSGKLLFLDLETTGLAGGAGTYAFLVGCGWFDGATFRLRQFFLADFGAERALLESVAELAAGTACVVTYNGKSFDLPLMETRFVLQRMPTPFADMPHVDMLHPARRLWREDDVECRLTNLERTLNGHEREGDVPGFEIPSRYFHYVRSGDARSLEGVLEHNRLDIISLAMLTARASQLLDDGPAEALTAREALGMGRLYERAGMTNEALEAFARAAQADGDTRAEALRAHATLCRRLRRYEAAASSWRRILELRACSAAIVREATEALAVHHEQRERDLTAATTYPLRSRQQQATAARQPAVQYRLARLERKIGTQPAIDRPSQSLFPLES